MTAPVATVFYDVLGRTLRPYVQNSDGTTLKEVGAKHYDELGRVSFEFRPANVDTDPCCPGTGYLYDVLGWVRNV